jgi:hypothetical protein
MSFRPGDVVKRIDVKGRRSYSSAVVSITGIKARYFVFTTSDHAVLQHRGFKRFLSLAMKCDN